jgi:hypothetical protein
LYDRDDEQLKRTGDLDFYRLMVRGETVGYFPPPLLQIKH